MIRKVLNFAHVILKTFLSSICSLRTKVIIPISLLVFGATFGAANASFQPMEYSIVITPDHFPIVFPKRNADGDPIDYGQSKQISGAELLNTDICYSSPNCSDEARAAGAVYFKAIDTNGDGIQDVVVYYDELGNLVGTQKISEITGYDATLVGRQDSNQYNSQASTTQAQQEAAVENTFPTDHKNYKVGTTSASFEVSPSGSANYSIPIVIPPAINGMQPELSINYNSQGGNGLLGVGFSIGGLSAITRCPKTKAQDGLSYNRKAVEYSNNDAFCLDGQRLILDSGVHGAADSIYRTEVDNFSRIRITFQMREGGYPGEFEVKTKEGLTYIYSMSVSMKGRLPKLSASPPALWPLAKVKNLSGQTISFNYTSNADDTTGYRPSTITYGSGSDVKTISFQYESRPDVTEAYTHGYKLKTDKRLSSIKVTHGDSNGIRKYDFAYMSGNEKSRIQQIQECGVPSVGSISYTECLAPITFDWDKKQFINSFSAAKSTSFTSLVHQNPEIGRIDTSRIKMGDFNGDGRTDIYRINGWGTTESDTIFFSNEDGTFTQKNTSFKTKVANNVSGAELNISRIKMGDFNGDGKTDVYTVNGWGQNISDTIYYSNGDDGTFTSVNTSFTTKVSGNATDAKVDVSRILFGDFNGDGKTDVYRINGSINHAELDKIYLSLDNGMFKEIDGLNIGTSWSNMARAAIWISRYKLGDFNGDGKTDIYYVNGYGAAASMDKIHLSNGDGTYKVINGLNTVVPGTDAAAINVISGIKLGDFNGDNLLDLYDINGNSPDKIYISQGDGNYAELAGLDLNSNVVSRLRLADFNQDGKTDIYYIGDFGHSEKDTLYYSTGTGFESHNTGIINVVANNSRLSDASRDISRIKFGDFNADGLIDVYRQNGSDTNVSDSIYTNINGLNKITGIKNGPLPKVSVEYARLTQGGSNLYSRGNNLFNPIEKTIILKSAVVKASSVDNGIGGFNRTTYKYTDLRYNRTGRGLQGFTGFEVTDLANKIRTSKTFRRDFPYTGKLAQMTKQVFDAVNPDNSLSNPRQVNKILKFYNHQTFESAQHPGKFRYNPVNTTTQTSYYEVASNSVSPYKTESENHGGIGNYDAEGNPLWTKITNSAVGDVQTKTITNTYYPANKTDWVIGKLKDITVVHHFSGASADPNTSDITRNSSFTYYPNGQLKTESIGSNTGDPTQQKTTSYEYDQYGLKSKITTTGAHPDGRVLTRVTNITRTPDSSYSHPAIKTTTKNSLNESESVWVSSLHGGQIGHRGPNGAETTASYDALGRKISETSSLNVTTNISYTWTFNEPLNSIYKITTQTHGLSDIQSAYYDSLDREILSTNKSLDGRDVKTETIYNAKGQKEKISRPYLAYSEPVWICYSYDEIGRTIQRNSPAAMNGSPSCEGGGRVTSSTQYDKLTTTTTDELGHVRKEMQNILGQMARVDEAYGTVDHSWLTYTYDAVGDLTSVTDAENTAANKKVTRLSYDNSGRKTEMQDPAMGKWRYQYNSFGELTRQTDAKQQVVTLEYDDVGRMIQRNDGEGQWVWKYATLADPDGIPVGKLKYVTGPNNYKKEFFYNDRLLPSKVTEQQALPGGVFGSLSKLSQSFYYDRYGRLSRQIQPDNFEVVNEYNSYGHLVAVKSPKTTISAAARAKLEARKAEAEQKVADAEARASTYLNQANSYQLKAIEYENYAISLLRKKGYEIRKEHITHTGGLVGQIIDAFKDKVGTKEAQNLYLAANNLRDISTRLISLANSERSAAQTALTTATSALTTPDAAQIHRGIAQAEAQQAIYKLEKAKSIVKQYKAGVTTSVKQITYKDANAQLQLAENMITDAQGAYSKFQDQLALADRYAAYAAGIDEDLKATGATTWWRAAAADAEGRITETIYGNGTTTKRVYDPNNGQLLNILTSNGVQTLQDLSYSYDHLDNVKIREDSVLHYSEGYRYDALDRLTRATMTVSGVGTSSRTWAYDRVGNIKEINGVQNTFTYDEADKITAKPSAGASYTYDANGNQEQSAGKTIEWSSFNKPVMLSKGQTRAEFTYNADHSRMLKVNKESLIISTTRVYFGDYEKVISKNGDIEHLHYITVGGEAVATRSIKTDAQGDSIAADTSNYLHKDALESVDLITDDAGGVVMRLGYTPYGKRRDMNALKAMTNYGSLFEINFSAVVSNRGFTGHEHIDELDLVHMNGRVYDPETGRFLSADPNVFNPYSTQGFNRYAYVIGNPMKYRDPSGFIPDDGNRGDSDDSDDNDTEESSGSGGGDSEDDKNTYGGDGNNGGSLRNDPSIEVIEVVGVRQPGGPWYEGTGNSFGNGVYGGVDPGLETVWDLGSFDEGIDSWLQSWADEVVYSDSLIDQAVFQTTVIGLGAIQFALSPKKKAETALEVAKDALEVAKKRVAPSIKEQAKTIKHQLNKDKNTVTIQTPDRQIHFDLDGPDHRDVPTPHVQQSKPNTNKVTGETFYNHDSKTVNEMTQQDIRTVRNYFERQNK